MVGPDKATGQFGLKMVIVHGIARIFSRAVKCLVGRRAKRNANVVVGRRKARASRVEKEGLLEGNVYDLAKGGAC